jgi:hypothetical protein
VPSEALNELREIRFNFGTTLLSIRSRSILKQSITITLMTHGIIILSMRTINITVISKMAISIFTLLPMHYTELQ